jgi:GNAT superfamily N-acetyltransferase
MPYLPNLHKEDEIRLWIRDILLSGHEVVVAEVGDRPAGFAALDGDELAHLYVHPGLQGRGIGDALLARVQELRPAGFRLWVFQRNTSARRFYERRGLHLVELTDGAGNDEREPDALYRWLPGELP